MSLEEWDDSLTPRLRTLQIIVASLVMGLVVFLGVSVMTQLQRAEAAKSGAEVPGVVVTYLALAAVTFALVARMIVPSLADAVARRQIAGGRTASLDSDADSTVRDRLLAAYQTRTIIACAILDGAGFFALVAYFVEGHWPALAAAGVVILGVAFQFPTRSRILSWLGDQQRLLVDEQAIR